MIDRLDDTIVAVSSPAGPGARGILRLSGPGAMAAVARVFESDSSEPVAHTRGHRRVPGRIRIDETGSIPGELYVFRAPRSYTRQDVAELHLVSSPPLLALLLEKMVDGGARHAEPGEFTARAFYAGTMDLTRVEGVAAVIHARSDAQLRASQALLHGTLSRQSAELRDRLGDLLALIEAEIDFAEEPTDFVSRAHVLAELQATAHDLERRLAEAISTDRIEAVPQAVLVGPPNAGKSTLFNRLTGIDRAIQSATAGTTRDVITAPAVVPGGEIMLQDTAGLAVSPPGHTTESAAVDRLAESAARRAIASADFVLMVVDILQIDRAALKAIRSSVSGVPVCLLLNKMDQAKPRDYECAAQTLTEFGVPLPVSGLTGEGVDRVRTTLGDALLNEIDAHSSHALALSRRQREALESALTALKSAKSLVNGVDALEACAELVTIEIRGAIEALSLLLGEVTTEDILGRIFDRFCIGK